MGGTTSWTIIGLMEANQSLQGPTVRPWTFMVRGLDEEPRWKPWKESKKLVSTGLRTMTGFTVCGPFDVQLEGLVVSLITVLSRTVLVFSSMSWTPTLCFFNP